MRLNKLTARQVETLRGPFKVGDGGGLWLKSRRPGDASWVFAYMRNGKARELGLGPLHSVSLAEARTRARQARQVILDGRDPIEAKREAQQAARVAALRAMTFREAALQLLATPKIAGLKNDKHRKQWRSTLENYAFPVLGDLPLQSIDTALVLKALLPVWKRTPETGARLRGRIERVIDWAKPLGLFQGENPASHDLLKDHLPATPKPAHHPALPYGEISQFVAALRERDGVSARALEFCILTATRTSGTIGATWDEIDLDAALWTIPAARMKGKSDHRVPLSDRAVEILRDLPHDGERIFALSNMAMLELLRGMRPGLTVHGMRSCFSDWARDRTAYARDVIEMSLAHAIGTSPRPHIGEAMHSTSAAGS